MARRHCFFGVASRPKPRRVPGPDRSHPQPDQQLASTFDTDNHFRRNVVVANV